MKTNKKDLRTCSPVLPVLIILSVMSLSAQAATAPDLGATANFAVLANTSVASAGTSTVFGDVGVSPGTSIAGFPPGIVNGSLHRGDALAAQAQSDLALAYNNVSVQAPASFLTGELGGLTLTPGVYRFNTTAALTAADLTLNAQGNPNAVFIFQIGTTLTTSGNVGVIRAGGATSSNVFWQVGDSATLSSTATFRGTILALNNIALNNLAAIDGRALARNGVVTLNNNLVQVPQVIRLVNLVPFALANGTDRLTMMVTVTNPPAVPVADAVILSSNRTQDAFDVPANQVVTNAAGQAVFNITSILPGAAKITATTGKNTVSTTVLFLAAPPVLTRITVLPASATVVLGSTANFTAVTLDQFGNAFPAIVTWNSSNTTVGTINAAGMFTAQAPGTTTITAFNGTVNGTATVTVATVLPVLTAINVIPALAGVVVGNTTNFTASALDQFGNAFPAILTWNSSNTTVGTINTAGMFTALAPGTTTIMAFNGTVNGTATAIVTATPIMKGDASGDNAVNIVDALFIAQQTVGMRTLTGTQMLAADVNGDNAVNIVDALFIAQFTVGLRPVL